MSVPWTWSPWLRDSVDVAPPLHEDLDAEVAVIGAGYAGLSAALSLRAAGLSVAVLEARVSGFGASGRNAGHLTPTIGKDLPTLLALYPRARARALVAFAEQALAHAEELIAAHGIACDYRPVGNLLAAVHPRQFKVIDELARSAAALGCPGEVLDAAEARRRGLPPAFLRGYLEAHGGVLNPARFVRGLRQAALDAGALLFEETPVVRLEAGREPVLHTPRGRVRARQVVIATNAYTGELKLPIPQVARLQVQLLCSEPLSPTQRAAIDWHGAEGVYTAHEILESHRLTACGRIVSGSKCVRYGFGNAALPDVDPKQAARLEATFRQRFPELRQVAVEHHWGGPIAFALDFLPRVGRAGKHRNLLYAIGFAGHGVAQASFAGRLLADLLLERESPGAPLWTGARMPLPPEPLRWLVARALIGFFERVDRRVDGQLARRARRLVAARSVPARPRA